MPLLCCSASYRRRAREKTVIRPKNTATRLKCVEIERYPSSNNAFNGAAAARIFADTRSGDITPGITRREALKEAFKLSDDIQAISGRVHAVVRVALAFAARASRRPPTLSSLDPPTLYLTVATTPATVKWTR